MFKQMILTAAAAVAATTMAQYAMNWSTIDGGGGKSAGGNYSLNGTIGQPDAGIMTAGNFTIQGGYWVPEAVQLSGGPWLNIAMDGGTNVLIWWESPDPTWLLQETDTLSSNWVDSVSGPLTPVSIPATNAHRFYRLREN